ncbi:MAG: hypothetical protein ACFFD2_03485 [Promethearchaeota archaeon]
MYYDSEEVCRSASLQSAGGEPSGRTDRPYRAGGTANFLPLGRSSSSKYERGRKIACNSNES